MSLELRALSWLRFERGCPCAFFERSPRSMCGKPDVLGITKAGYMLEIEIKRSVSDFKANEHKYHLRSRYDGTGTDHDKRRWPKYYWFLVPRNLVDRVQSITPEWSGLLTPPGKGLCGWLDVIKPAPVNSESARLTTKQKINVGKCMANQIYSLAISMENQFIYSQQYEQGLGI